MRKLSVSRSYLRKAMRAKLILVALLIMAGGTFAQSSDRALFPTQRIQIVQNKLDEIQGQWDEAPWIGAKGWSAFAKLIPGWAWYVNRNRVEVPQGNPFFLQGQNLEAQISYLYGLPPERFQITLDYAVDSLAEADLGEALAYVSAVKRLSSNDIQTRNFLDVARLVVAIGMAGFMFWKSRPSSKGKLESATPGA